MKKSLLLLCLVLLLPSCMSIPSTSKELRDNVKAGNFGTERESITINAPLKKVVQRVAKKAENCMHYTFTMTGGGVVQYKYVPKVVWQSKKEASLMLNMRFRQKSGFVEEDVSGIALVADMKKVSKNRTEITVFMGAGLGIKKHFYDAIQTSAQGLKGSCPAEIK